MSKKVSTKTYQRINGANFSSIRRKRRKSNGCVWSSIVFLLLLGLGAGYAYWLHTRPTGRHTETVYLLIDSKTDSEALREQIHRKIYPLRPQLFDIYWKLYDVESKIRTGRYAIPTGVNTRTLIQILTEGPQALVSVPLTGIRTEQEFISTLDRFLMADSAELLSAWTDSAELAKLGCSREEALGLVFAENYDLPWDIDPSSLRDSIILRYKAFWTPDRRTQLDSLELSPLQLSTLASIIEEESNKLDEYALISGLYINRLRKGMPLQSDPTVKYALGDFSLRRILRVHLSTPSPYNTYYTVGLPPGPIRIPKRSTLEAILKTKPHNYLYMCAKEDFSGYHNFSSSYTEHLRNARLYQRELDRRGIK